jgi:hypothetical protein
LPRVKERWTTLEKGDGSITETEEERSIPAATPIDDDDDESITTILDNMIVGLGLRNQVNSNIEDMREQPLAAE